MAISYGWMGAVTTTSAVVKVRSDQASAQLTGAGTVDGIEGADDVFTFTLSSLSADTAYTVTVDDGAETWVGSFTTPKSGAMSFSFAAASCCGQGLAGGVGDSSVYTMIEARSPDFFIHMGDFHYKDIITNDVGLFHDAYEQVLAQPKMASMYESVPAVYMFDDHDFGANNSDGTSPSKPAAQTAYRDCVPHYPMVDSGGTYQTWVYGRVRFVMVDPRSFRNLEAGSMLGSTQLAWLTNIMDTMTEELLVFVSVVPWLGTNSEGFGGYTAERQTIAEAITDNGLTDRTLVLHGDVHMVAIDNGGLSQFDPAGIGLGPHVACFAPMNATNSAGPDNYYIGPDTTTNTMYGMIDITDDGDVIRVDLEGWAVSGATEQSVASLSFSTGERASTMTAEEDIAVIVNDGDVTPLEVNTALTSVLARAGVVSVIETVTLAVDTASITFSSIPSTFTTLRLIGRARSDYTVSRADEILMRVGNSTVDTGTNYDYFTRTSRSDGADLEESSQASNHIAIAGSIIPAEMTGFEAGEMGIVTVDIYQYADTSFYKPCVSSYFGSTQGDANRIGAGWGGGVWKSSSAIDIITLYPENSNFVAGSEFTLIGIG